MAPIAQAQRQRFPVEKLRAHELRGVSVEKKLHGEPALGIDGIDHIAFQNRFAAAHETHP